MFHLLRKLYAAHCVTITTLFKTDLPLVADDVETRNYCWRVTGAAPPVTCRAAGSHVTVLEVTEPL